MQAIANRVADIFDLPGEDQPSLFQRLREEIPAHENLLARLEQAAAEFPPGPERNATIAAWITSTGEVATVSTDRVDRIGPYKILDRLGAGGMGIVYLAEQKDPVRRRVAIKLIKLGMDSAQVLARFELERQALAVMSHPTIAKVLDAGTTEQGQPYFVMECVEGPWPISVSVISETIGTTRRPVSSDAPFELSLATHLPIRSSQARC